MLIYAQFSKQECCYVYRYKNICYPMLGFLLQFGVEINQSFFCEIYLIAFLVKITSLKHT